MSYSIIQRFKNHTADDQKTIVTRYHVNLSEIGFEFDTALIAFCMTQFNPIVSMSLLPDGRCFQIQLAEKSEFLTFILENQKDWK